jgi:dTDP-4-dehydrorhamnose reductase
MSILVCGAAGQVGHELVSRAGARALTGLDRKALDITDAAAVGTAFDTFRPRVVINAAAYTAVDKAETETAAAFAINRDAPRILAQACRDRGIPLLHLSTDYVFDGSSAEPYTEDAPTAPLGAYGLSKWEGEQAIRQVLREHLIIRVAWVFGAHGNNFVRTMLRLGRDRPKLSVVADQHGAPTHAGSIAEMLLTLADRILAGESLPWGTYHYTGEPETTWHGFALAIFSEAQARGLLEQPPAVQAITTAEYPTPARRPAHSALDGQNAFKHLGIRREPWIKGLREVLDTWKDAP